MILAKIDTIFGFEKSKLHGHNCILKKIGNPDLLVYYFRKKPVKTPIINTILMHTVFTVARVTATTVIA